MTDSDSLKKRRPNIGTLVLGGFILGIATGLFFGEQAAFLGDFGRAYVRLLQMAIIPYVVVSLIAGLGRLTPHQASRIAVYGGGVLLILLAAGSIVMLLAPLSYPDWEAANYFSSSLISSPSTVDFASLYITSNPFDALSNTVVPAIVTFSIIMGVAVMVSKRKTVLLNLLGELDESLMNITRFVVRIAPLGIFAISAHAAGTLDITSLDKLQVYIWSYLALWLVYFFILLPGLLAAFTPVTYREIFAACRIPFITAFVTSSVMVVLPMLIQQINLILEKHKLNDEETDAAVDVIIPTSFNFPSLAMLLVLSFVLFAGWYSGNPLLFSQYPEFMTIGLFVAFGGSNIALPFLLDLFRLPADLFQLFLVGNVITGFFFAALSAMHLVILTLMTIFLIKKRVRVRPVMLLLVAVLMVIGTPLLLHGTSSMISRFVNYEYTGYTEFVGRKISDTDIKIRSADYREDMPVSEQSIGKLEQIETSGWLRVGFTSNALPWVFRNNENELVGFDMHLLHRFARDLQVGIELVQIEPSQLAHALASRQVDIFASGLLLDVDLLKSMDLSDPYWKVNIGILVEDHRRHEFETTKQIRSATKSSFAVTQANNLTNWLKVSLPDNEFQLVDSPRAFLRGEMPGVDAIIMSAEAASAWTLVYTDYTAVIPAPTKLQIPIVFALPKGDSEFRLYVNSWLQLADSTGEINKAYKTWILGQQTTLKEPRWSVIRNVLHWVD